MMLRDEIRKLSYDEKLSLIDYIWNSVAKENEPKQPKNKKTSDIKDSALLNSMKEVDRTKFVSRQEVMKKLRKK
jgi:putative addiction module component (TIGR02574 family)